MKWTDGLSLVSQWTSPTHLECLDISTIWLLLLQCTMHTPPNYQVILLLTECCNPTKSYLIQRLWSPTHPKTQLNSFVVHNAAQNEDVMMEKCPTNYMLRRSSRFPQVIHPSDSTCCTQNWSPSWSLLWSLSALTSVVRYVTSCATHIVFICFDQVLGLPNELCSWSLQGVHNMSYTYIRHTSNQMSLWPNCLYHQVCDRFYNHPPCPSALFHHKLCSRPIQFVHPYQPSIALSRKPLS